MTVLMLVLVTACEQPVVDMKPTEPEQKPTPVPGVKLDRTTLMLAVGETGNGKRRQSDWLGKRSQQGGTDAGKSGENSGGDRVEFKFI